MFEIDRIQPRLQRRRSALQVSSQPLEVWHVWRRACQSPRPPADPSRAVSKSDMPWLIPLCLWLALLAIVGGVFIASVKNARALRRDLNQRFDGVQARLEKQANALADELLARTKDTTE